MFFKRAHNRYRMKKKFLIFPHKIDGKWYWLTMVNAIQQYMTGEESPPDICVYGNVSWWKTISFELIN